MLVLRSCQHVQLQLHIRVNVIVVLTSNNKECNTVGPGRLPTRRAACRAKFSKSVATGRQHTAVQIRIFS